MPSTLNAASNGICPAALGSSSLDYIHFTEEENRGSEQLSDRVPGHMPHTAHSLLHGRGGIWRSSIGKESACNLGDLGLIPGLGRSPGEGKGYPLQYSGLEKSTDFTVHGVAKSRTRLRKRKEIGNKRRKNKGNKQKNNKWHG